MTVSLPNINTSLRVREWTEQLCRSLEDNYRNYKVRMLTNNSRRFSQGDNILGERTDLSDYAKSQLKEISDGVEGSLMKFRAIEGKKYYKVVQREFRSGEWVDSSVNAFVNKFTGEVHKAASWRSPVKGARYDMRIIRHREFLHNPDMVDWAGGYLYKR
tara:strand:+ start:840 stop:1316 length:477 start_codon:yes stop_codon:yes gene_type:complete